MTGLIPWSLFACLWPTRSERDAGWYGTLGLLAACLGVLAAASFMG